jgi:uncharacterized membrane protein YhiD involved in acid resistance
MIWFVAAIGVAIGADYYVVATIATAFALGTVIGLRRMERRMNQRRFFHLHVQLPGNPQDFQVLEELIQKDNTFKVSASRLQYDKNAGRINTKFDIEAGKGGTFHSLLSMLESRFPQAESIEIEH